MAETDLIAETNRLLRTILENDAEQRELSKETMDKLKTMREEHETKRDEAMKARLREQGLPEEAVEGSDEDWGVRQKEARRRSQEQIEESSQRNARYQEDLLAELRAQSELLRQIAERLER